MEKPVTVEVQEADGCLNGKKSVEKNLKVGVG